MKKKTKAARLGECCPVLELVLSRQKDTDKIGLSIGQMMFLSTGKPLRSALVYNMRRGKKGDGKFAAYADTTYASVKHCPFCGTALESEG